MMIPLQSNLENMETSFATADQNLNKFNFTVGGNWDYEHGCFDRNLDEANKVWLRIPFEVTSGTFDPEQDNVQADIRIGTPFVLKHLYNEGLDKEAGLMTYRGLVDQFQDPVDKDAEVEQEWVNEAAGILRLVEKDFVS